MPRVRGRGRSAIVRRKCPVHNYFLGSDGVCARCNENEQQQVDAGQDVAADNVNPPIPPDAPNDEETTGVERADVEMCGKCCRISTIFQTRLSICQY